MSLVIVGLRATGVPAARKLAKSDGTEAWYIARGNHLNAVAVNPVTERLVVAGSSDNDLTTHVLNFAGVEQWAANHGTTVRAVAIGLDGHVYTGSGVTGSITTRKYPSAGGTPVWSVNHGDTVWGIAVDAANKVYAAGLRTSEITLRTYLPDGTPDWTYDHGDHLYAVAVDLNGNVYIGGVTGTGGSRLRKLDPDGNVLWSTILGGTIRSLSVDAEGNVYWAGDRYGVFPDGYRTHGSLTPSGSSRWAGDHGANVLGISVEPSGRLFITGVLTGGVTTRCLLADTGVEQWTFDHGLESRGVEVDAGRIGAGFWSPPPVLIVPSRLRAGRRSGGDDVRFPTIPVHVRINNSGTVAVLCSNKDTPASPTFSAIASGEWLTVEDVTESKTVLLPAAQWVTCVSLSGEGHEAFINPINLQAG